MVWFAFGFVLVRFWFRFGFYEISHIKNKPPRWRPVRCCRSKSRVGRLLFRIRVRVGSVFDGESGQPPVDGLDVLGHGHVDVDALKLRSVEFQNPNIGEHPVLGSHQGEVRLEVAQSVRVGFVGFKVFDGVGQQVATDRIILVGGSFLPSAGLFSSHIIRT